MAAGTQAYSHEAFSPAPPGVVFAILADSARWPDWAGPLIRHGSVEREGTPPPGGVGAIRRLGTTRFFSREEIVAYDPPHHLAYVILSGQPVRNYRAEVTLTPSDVDGGGTHISWRATFDPRIPGTGPLLRRYLGAIVGGFTRRLAAYAGTQASGRSG
jgi:uncharacterized protein YndB with AHSA1/START domain